MGRTGREWKRCAVGEGEGLLVGRLSSGVRVREREDVLRGEGIIRGGEEGRGAAGTKAQRVYVLQGRGLVRGYQGEDGRSAFRRESARSGAVQEVGVVGGSMVRHTRGLRRPADAWPERKAKQRYYVLGQGGGHEAAVR